MPCKIEARHESWLFIETNCLWSDKFDLVIHQRLSSILKTKKVYEVMFFDMLKWIYSERLLNTLYTEIKGKCWNNLFWTKEMLKKSLFFICNLQLITVLLLICDSYISWSIRFVSPKMYMGFSIFDSVSFLLEFIFLSNKKLGLFDFKMS